MPRKPPIEKLRLAEHGQFITGFPVTFEFMRNTAPSVKFHDNQFGQNEEPAGRYMLTIEPSFDIEKAPGWEKGTITFTKPLVLAWGLQQYTRYTDPDNWKQQVASAYGKKGKALSLALLEDGFDGIVTVRDGEVSEIIDLTVIGQPAITPPDIFDWSNPGGKGRDGTHIRTTRHGNTTIVYGVGHESVEIASLRTPATKRRNGSARAAMIAFLEEADARGLNVKLQASPLDKKTSAARLVAFYRSLGFELTGKTINPAGDPEMLRVSPAHKPDIVLHGTRQPNQPNELNVTDGLLGHGIYVSRSRQIATEYVPDATDDRGLLTDPALVAMDAQHIRFKCLTREQHRADRETHYHVEQDRNGGEWDASCATRAKHNLRSKYLAEGFDGIYVEEDNLGVIFSERIGHAKRLGIVDAVGQTVIVDGVNRWARNSKGELLADTHEGVREFWRWFDTSATVDGRGRPLVMWPAMPETSRSDSAIWLEAKDHGAGHPASGTAVPNYYAAIKAPCNLVLDDLTTPVELSTVIEGLRAGIASRDLVFSNAIISYNAGTSPLKSDAALSILNGIEPTNEQRPAREWLSAIPELSEATRKAGFDGWSYTTHGLEAQDWAYMPLLGASQLRDTTFPRGLDQKTEAEALAFIQAQPVSGVRFVPARLITDRLCLAAVRLPGNAVLKYAPENMKTLELCIAAVIHNGTAFYDVPGSQRRRVIDDVMTHQEMTSEQRNKMAYVALVHGWTDDLRQMLYLDANFIDPTCSVWQLSEGNMRTTLAALQREAELHHANALQSVKAAPRVRL